MNDIKKYVLGFLFDADGQHVALIIKARPAWQRGKLNGIGGKILPGETPLRAMTREFAEETGCDEPVPWQWFCDLGDAGASGGPTWMVSCFRARLGVGVHGGKYVAQVVTDEPTGWARVSNVVTGATLRKPVFLSGRDEGTTMAGRLALPNLGWLVPLALDTAVRGAMVDDKGENF